MAPIDSLLAADELPAFSADFGFSSGFPTPPSEEGPDFDPQTLLGATRSLMETGTTGLGPDVDLEAAASSKLQLASATNPGDTQALLRAIQEEQIPAIQKKMAEQMQAATQGAELTPQQAIAAAILQIAPIIIGGAMAGKSGAAIGAAAGGAGGTTLLKGITEENELKQKNAYAQAQQSAAELKGLQTQAFNLQRDEAKNEFTAEQNEERNASRERAANIGRPPRQVDASTIKTIGAGKAVEKEIDRVISFIEENFEDESLSDVLYRKGASYLPDSKERDLESRLQKVILLQTEAVSTGAPSNFDVERMAKALTSGDGASVQSILRALRAGKESQQISTSSLLEASEAAGRDISGFQPSTAQPPRVNLTPQQRADIKANLGKFSGGRGDPKIEAMAAEYVGRLRANGISDQQIYEILQ